MVNGSLSIDGEPLLADKTFVFESNYLKYVPDGEATPVYTVYGQSVEIAIFNHDGLDMTNANLSYTIATDKGTLNATEGTLTGKTKSQQIHTLTYDGTGDVTVEAHSTSPQLKDLKAIFRFAEQTTGYYTVTDHERYVEIDIYTGKAITGITVIGADGLVPDATNTLLDGVNVKALEPNKHYSFVYFKQISQAYTDVPQTALTDSINLTKEGE